ncbi:MAG: AAA family ATPase [Spirochaetaceae bacterium]|nr:AAA family ATPase [Spirochaetaceae bacterium]MCF7950840.1 AAA family ATPase [Spirochaetaceae bacterium]
MKLLLNRMRLVNWHYFQDETVRFKEISLLAGDNGSGKSTIIDALQYALVANINKIRFNSSAATSRQSARSLESYVRCKMGMEGAEYARGDTIAHIVLEFSAADRIFCAGVMVEAFTDASVKESQWVLDNHRLDDIPLSRDGFYRAAKELRSSLQEMGAVLCATKREYNAQLTMRLKVHRRNVSFNPYLEALLRSVSFTPLTSVDQFVCDYILEERFVDVSAMRENLNNYREAEEEATLMERKITALEEIARSQEETDTISRQIESQDYLRLKAGHLAVQREAEVNAVALKRARGNLAAVQQQLANLEERRSRYEQLRDELRAALAGNDTQRLLESLETKRAELTRRRDEFHRQAERFEQVLRESAEKLERSLAEDIDSEISSVGEELDAVGEQVAGLNARVKGQLVELADLQSELEELETGRLRYPAAVERLKAALEAEGLQTWIFAELLEMSDSQWRNAVEGVLGDRRFDLLVEDMHFAQAAELYKQQEPEVAGVGLPYLARMEAAEATAGSLAEMVETENPLALRYSAQLMGDIIRTDRENLTEFDRAISPDCVYYTGHTVFRLEPQVYSRWYIGGEARRRRHELITAEIKRLKGEYAAARRELEQAVQRRQMLTEVFAQLNQVKDLAESRRLEEQYSEHCREVDRQIGEIDVSEIEDLRGRIKTAEEELAGLRNERALADEKVGELRGEIDRREADAAGLEVAEGQAADRLEEFLSERRHRLDEFEAYFLERLRGGESASLQDVRTLLANYENARKGLETRLKGAKDELLKLKSRFNRDYRLMLDETVEGSQPFVDLLLRYRDTELPAYREKIARARREAERQFKEHFVARMNEYINDARESFSEINHTLKEISFGEDQYSFSIRERPEKRQILEVFRTAMKVEEYKDTLFESLTSEEERQSIEALFEEILTNDLDSPRVREICDYRTYFTYDIRIRHMHSIDKSSGKPHESNLSKVLREKSGGEAQTPYYVALGASFFRFFKEEEGAIRLALFDEAFNKMDDTRIGTALTFFRRLGMQVVTAVPTEKIETIAPYSDQVNLIFRHNYRAYAREFSQDSPQVEVPSSV